MSLKHNDSSLLLCTAAVTALASNFLPCVAFASVGAGAGLPYEDTFSKIVTSVTGPWAWTVAIVCVVIFCWRAVQQGGDLGGSTVAFLGPAFICTLLLGSKKLMTFFGQGAMLEPPSILESPAAVASAVVTSVLLIGGATLLLRRRARRSKQQRPCETLSLES